MKKDNLILLLRLTISIMAVLMLIVSCHTPVEDESNEETSYVQDLIGIWKYVTDFDGTTYASSSAGYTAASAGTDAMRYNSDYTAEDGDYDGVNFTVDTSLITLATWSLSSLTLTFNYTLATGGSYTDIYQVTLENNKQNAICLLTSTTNPGKTAVVNQYVMYCVKQ